MRVSVRLWTCVAFLLTSVAFGLAEPEVSEEDEGPGPYAVVWDRIRLNGRFDLVLDVAQRDHVRAKTGNNRSAVVLGNYHTFLFFNVQIGSNTTFLGTAYVGDNTAQTFFQAERAININSKFGFGKILVPFGGPPFHQWYGGVGGHPSEAIMIPNIWAEPGIYLHLEETYLKGRLSIGSDTYVVQPTSGSGDVLLPAANRDRPAFGQRFRLYLFDYTILWLSYYLDPFRSGDNESTLSGVDIFHDPRWTGIPILSHMEIRAGFARINRNRIGKSEGLFDYSRFRDIGYADYIQVTYVGLASLIKPRLRYGSFADPDRLSLLQPSVTRLHHLVASLFIPETT